MPRGGVSGAPRRQAAAYRPPPNSQPPAAISPPPGQAKVIARSAPCSLDAEAELLLRAGFFDDVDARMRRAPYWPRRLQEVTTSADAYADRYRRRRALMTRVCRLGAPTHHYRHARHRRRRRRSPRRFRRHIFVAVPLPPHFECRASIISLLRWL